ncbi:type II toxin-antitoxin system VapC family toxin [Spirosoma pulveris]
MRFLLDTNILLNLLRATELYKKVERDLDLSNPSNDILISAVSKGELMALGIRNKWGASKMHSLSELLNKLVIIDIIADDHSLFDIYSQMDCYSQNVLPGTSLPSTHSARKMGKNDLWIAAAAHLTKSTLVTTDGDFVNLALKYISLKHVVV